MSRRFAVAARELEGPPRGVGRWLREVLAGWRASGCDTGIALYLERGLPADVPPGKFELRVTGPGPGGGATAWEQWALAQALARDRPAAMLGPAYALPVLARVPGVVVLHDLSFEARPDWFSVREGTRRRVLARLAARQARLVVAVSLWGAREIAARYRVAPERLRVIPNGVSSRFTPLGDPIRLGRLRREHDLDGDLVLAVGSFFTRRRLPDLIDAVGILARDRPRIRLVLIGDNRTWPPIDVRERLRAAGLEGRALWLETVGDDDLIGLYSLARVCVYLSEYEGFGLPPLEALACGCPVVASGGTALGDNLAGRAELVADHAPETVAAAIARVLDRAAPPRERPEWLARFSWERAAAAVHTALEEAAR